MLGVYIVSLKKAEQTAIFGTKQIFQSRFLFVIYDELTIE